MCPQEQKGYAVAFNAIALADSLRVVTSKPNRKPRLLHDDIYPTYILRI